MIYHLAIAREWEAGDGDYTVSTLGKSLAEQGFIHCSFRDQVQRIADLVYRGRNDVVLLTIDPERLRVPVKVEHADGGDEEFPHIYGPLPRRAVVATAPLTPQADGRLDVGRAFSD